VGVGSPLPRVAAASRAVDRWHGVPAPEDGSDAFLEALRRALDDGAYEVVFGGDRDTEALALSKLREQIPAVVPYASHDRLLRAIDKGSLQETADAVGIAVPRTVALGAAAPTTSNPLVVKPRIDNMLERHEPETTLDAHLATTSAEVERLATEIREAGATPIVQEHVAGTLMALAMVMDRDGEAVARVQQVSDLIHPPRAGISVRARTVPIDEELAGQAAALLARLGWFGLAQIQFVVPADGRPRLIDLNGRFYGSLALALAAGVNLPAIWATLATRRPAGAPVDAAPGVRYQWLWGDVARALVERRGGVARDLLDTGRFAVRANHSVWRVGDPWPAVHYVRLMLRQRRLRRERGAG
jgi:predicted ATP-grasp superfamily ATP-dependent carboligase